MSRVNIVTKSVESGVAIRINLRRSKRLIEVTVLAVVCSIKNISGFISASAIRVEVITTILPGFMLNVLGILYHFTSQVITNFGRFLVPTLLVAILKNNIPLSFRNSCNGIRPCSPSGMVTGIHFSFLF